MHTWPNCISKISREPSIALPRTKNCPNLFSARDTTHFGVGRFNDSNNVELCGASAVSGKSFAIKFNGCHVRENTPGELSGLWLKPTKGGFSFKVGGSCDPDGPFCKVEVG
eukprot:symbB.v1.2.033346.t1/scaffold4131.1/size79631/1